MSSADFANYAIRNGCEIDQFGSADVIRIYNPKKSGAKFNLPNYSTLFPRLANIGCIKLGIPLIGAPDLV